MKLYRLQSKMLEGLRQNIFNEIAIRNFYETKNEVLKVTHLNFQNIPQ